jgi:hypothetical protein
VTGQGVIGRDCAWCDRPAVGEVEVQPAHHRTITRRDPVSGRRIPHQVLVQAAIVAAVCDDHKHITTAQPPLVKLPRQTKARGVEQLGLFAGANEVRQRNAISGDSDR